MRARTGCGGAVLVVALSACAGSAQTAADAGAVCAYADGGSAGCLWSACAGGDVCFTQVACGPLPDGGTACSRAPGEADDRCHRACSGEAACPEGEECRQVRFFGCHDYDGAGSGGRFVCLPR